MSNSLVWVPQGGMLQISRTILHAELPGARDSDITYTITEEQPRHGKSPAVLLPHSSTLPGCYVHVWGNISFGW